jgi:hypothetical protein
MRMTNSELELCAITGTFKGIPLYRVDLDNYLDDDDALRDLDIVVQLYNWEVLDGETGTQVAKYLLRKIGIQIH